jgi:hypothetical protein
MKRKKFVCPLSAPKLLQHSYCLSSEFQDMRRLALLLYLFCLSFHTLAQANNEIQVYASPTIQQGWTIFELHSNYTFKVRKLLADPRQSRWTNETLEITHGFGKNFEVGFYTFTGVAPGGKFQYLGNQLRPRVTVPGSWGWNAGASISFEFGFFRPDDTTRFVWQGEVRPIIDKTINAWYFAFNPNIDFAFSGDDKGVGIAPQFKTVYSVKENFGIGLEYYGALGSFQKILPVHIQEHLLGPMIDLYIHPMWEINGGFLFGLTGNSNQRIVKLLLGRRIKK